jgi:Lrp/AsnC family transcriptional regulator for asnA, asnC and gidA
MKSETRAIDEIDTKIIMSLLKEARTTFTDMAKECKITISAVRTRFTRLKKEGIINGAIMQVNPYSLGFKCVCDITLKTDPEKEKAKEVMAFLKEKKYPQVIFGPRGRYNMDIVAILPSFTELRGVLEEMEASPHIKHVESLIWTEVVNVDHPENLVLTPIKQLEKKKVNCEMPIVNQNEIKIDEIDRQIAEILSGSARTPFRRIAEQLNISTKNVIKRYKKLRGNVLTISTITVNLQKLGYKAIAHLHIKVANKSETTRIFTQLLQIPNLLVAIRFIGHYDIKAMVTLKDFEEMFSLADKIDKIKGIEQTDTFLTKAFPVWPFNMFASTLTEPSQSKTVVINSRFKQKI